MTVGAAGPSYVVFDYGMAVSWNEGHLWDDELSNQELDIICGVYKVRSGKFKVSCMNR